MSTVYIVIIYYSHNLYSSDTGGLGSKLLGFKTMNISSPKEIKSEWVALYEQQDDLRSESNFVHNTT